ncbi:hypothetical protein MesoLjLc_78220 [Mesorhizobium sp. L-8-10]|nr:hypothetical protein MesoLjLc_78220 [Mesorhizobium sp. L-8-10]
MLAALLKRQFAQFENRYGYDTAYMRELADIDAVGALKLGLANGFTRHRFGLPANVYFAAKLTGTKWADCGSCLRLVVDMAVEAGVARADVADLLTGSPGAPPDMKLAARYAAAIIANDPELAEIAAECERRWGRQGIAGLAAATVSGLFYPLFKRGMGYGNACEPVVAALRAETAALEKAGAGS